MRARRLARERPSNLALYEKQLELKHQRANVINRRNLEAQAKSAATAARDLAKARAENAKHRGRPVRGSSAPGFMRLESRPRAGGPVSGDTGERRVGMVGSSKARGDHPTPTTVVASLITGEARNQFHLTAGSSNNAKRYWDASTPARNLEQKELEPWDFTPKIGVPWALRGLKLEPRRRDHQPWAKEVIDAWNSPGGSMGFTPYQLPARPKRSPPRAAEALEASRAAERMGRQPWDSSPSIPVPARCQYIKPLTYEPWVRDQAELMHHEFRRMEEDEQEQADVAVMKITVD